MSVLLAPTLLCEGSLSMDLYAANLNAEFLQMADLPCLITVLPYSSRSTSKAARYFLRNVVFPLAIMRHSKVGSILHVLDHSNGHLCRYHPKSVVTCHDIAEYRETALNDRQLRHWKWRVEGIKKAVRIVAVSRHTKEDLVEILGIPEERITVAHNGVSPIFRPWEHMVALENIPELNLSGLKILHVGSNIQRKNLPVLIRALGLLRKRNVDFWFIKVGQQFPSDQLKMIEQAGIGDRVVHLGRRPTEEIPMIYSLCDFFVFPSTYEGFGLPVLEAQACGTPAILARSSCLAEVGGDAALYFEPRSEDELAERIMEAAVQEKREQLIAAGFENAKLYTWRAHAEKVAQVYKEIL